MRALRLSLWPAVIALGIAAESAGFGLDDPRRWLPDLLAGWTLAGCGLVAWSRRPDSRSGPLLVATGICWFLGNFAADALYVYRGPLVHLLVTYPSGRATSRREVAAIATGYAAAVVEPVWSSEVASIVLAGLLAAVCAGSYARAAGPVRRARLIGVEAAAALAVAIAGGAAARLALPDSDASEPSLLALEAALCLVAGMLLAGLISPALRRDQVTDLVIELGAGRGRTLRDELARALADPTLEVGYRLPGSAVFADLEGRPIALPQDGSERALTLVDGESGPVAALVHDPAVLGDPGLRDAVTTATALAAANARLTAAVRAQVRELRESRLRILAAGDEERSRLERRLREGAQARLERLAVQLAALRHTDATADERIVRAEEQLARTLDDLRRLARGLHPGALAAAGLAGAVASLAERSPVPVRVAAPLPELPADIAAAVYFVCSEALANAAKHADATAVSLAVTAAGGRATVVVTDDGRGGADADRGTGLRGLADRVEALGGVLRVESPVGAGTRLAAELPLNGSSSTASRSTGTDRPDPSAGPA